MAAPSASSSAAPSASSSAPSASSCAPPAAPSWAASRPDFPEHVNHFCSLFAVSLTHVVGFYRDVALGVQPKPSARWEKAVAGLAKVVDAAVPLAPVEAFVTAMTAGAVLVAEQREQRRAERGAGDEADKSAGGGGGVRRPHEWGTLFESLVEVDDAFVAALGEVAGYHLATHLDFFLQHRLAQRYDALATVAMGAAVRALDHLSRNNAPLSVEGLVRGAMLGRSGREAEDFLNTPVKQDESKAVRAGATVEGVLGRSGLVALDEAGEAEWYDFVEKERSSSKYGYRLVPLAMAHEAASAVGDKQASFKRRSEPPDEEFVEWFKSDGRSGFVEAAHLDLLGVGNGDVSDVAKRARKVLGVRVAVLSGEFRGGANAPRLDLRSVAAGGCVLREVAVSSAAGCDLRFARLEDVALADSDPNVLNGSKLSYSELVGCSVRGCRLVGCEWEGGVVQRCVLRNVGLSETQLSKLDTDYESLATYSSRGEEAQRMVGGLQLQVDEQVGGLQQQVGQQVGELQQHVDQQVDGLQQRMDAVEQFHFERVRRAGVDDRLEFNLPVRSKVFEGRDEELESVIALVEGGLAGSDRARAVALTAALGQGGVGKTALASEVVHRLREGVQLVGWIPCERVETCKEALVALGRKLLCGISDDDDLEAALKKVFAELERRRGEWLLVFDNAEDVDEIEPLLPTGGQVLITARNGAWGDVGDVRATELELPTEAKAVEMLRALMGVGELVEKDEEALLQVAKELGRLPLALAQAAGYWRSQAGMSITELLKDLRLEPECVLAEEELATNPAYVRRAEVSEAERRSLGVMNRLWERNRAALRAKAAARREVVGVDGECLSEAVLVRLAYLAPEGIPRSAVAALVQRLEQRTSGGKGSGGGGAQRGGTRRRVQQVLNDLAQLRLVEVSGASLSMHRVTQTVLRLRVQGEHEPRRVRTSDVDVTAVVEDVVEVMYDAVTPARGKEVGTATAVWSAHAAVLVEYAAGRKWEGDAWRLALAKAQFVSVCDREEARLRFGEYVPELERVVTEVEKEVEARGGDVDEDTSGLLAVASAQLSWCLRLQGCYQQALDVATSALQRVRDVLGCDDDVRVGRLLHTRGTAFHDMAGLDKAWAMYEKALKVFEHVLGEEHSLYAATLGNMAGVRLQQGKLKQAYAMYEEALVITERTLGKEHSSYARTLANMANVLKQQGKLEQACTKYEEALAIQEHTLGKEHSEYARTLGNMAIVLQSQGKLEQAFAMHEEALAIMERTLGKEHSEYARTLGNVAVVLQSQGKLEQALPKFSEAVRILSTSLRDGHPHTCFFVRKQQECERALRDSHRAPT